MTADTLSLFTRFRRYKLFLWRQNTKVKVERRLFRTVGYDSVALPLLRALFQQPQGYFTSAASDIMKDDRTSSVFLLNVSGVHWVVKRYNFRGWGYLIKGCFRMSRARRSWLNAHLLHHAGIATVTPLAFLERRLGFLRLKSYFVADYLEGSLLSDYFTSDVEAVEKIKVADRVIKLLQQLAENAVHHGDLKATNILLHQGQPVLLDLDALRFYPDSQDKHFRRQFAKDIKRFMKNWQQLPEIDGLFTQRLNVLQQYGYQVKVGE